MGGSREVSFPDPGTDISLDQFSIEGRAEDAPLLEFRARVLAVRPGAAIEADLGDEVPQAECREHRARIGLAVLRDFCASKLPLVDFLWQQLDRVTDLAEQPHDLSEGLR